MKWNQIIYKDCMNEEDGLPTLEDKSIDLGITDPPWNVDYGDRGLSFNSKFNKKNREVLEFKGEAYDDNRNDYDEWCNKWFNELLRICNGIIIYSGMKNLKMWINKKKYKGIAIHYVSNSRSNGFISYRTCIKPLIFFGKINRLGNDFFDYWEKWGFKRDNKAKIHPCPLNYDFWYDLIKKIKPNTILDPFIGSGTTAEVCTKLGIPYIGYEINKVYKQDVDKRLRNVKKEPQQIKLKI